MQSATGSISGQSGSFVACKIISSGASDIGRRRPQNQDTLFLDDQIGLYIVADGMGGHNAGKTASSLAVETISAFIRRTREQERLTWPYGIDPQISYNGNGLRTAMMLANRRIWREAESQDRYTGMGTTVVAALADGGMMSIAHAGDSRAYRIHQSAIEQLTTDDTWVQAVVETGIVQHDQARNHRLKNIITKAVGAEQNIEVPVIEQCLEPGDHLLLCSDGLHGMVQDSRILEIVRSAGGDLGKAVSALIEAANSGGGKDNITVILVSCGLISD